MSEKTNADRVGDVPKLRPPLWITVLWAGAVLAAAVVYPDLPQEIPIHWNIGGEVDDYAPKQWAVPLMFLLSPAIYFGMAATARIDPSRKNYAEFLRAFEWLRAVLTLFPLAMLAVVGASGAGIALDIPKVVGGLISLLIMVIGNRLGQLRHSYFIGIRTPWTLASETVWRRTHRMAGWVWTAAGLVGLITVVWVGPPLSFYVLIGGILIASLGSMVYSYFLWRASDR